MLLTRVLTVAVLLPLFLVALFLLPNLYWGLLILGVIVAAGWEWGALVGYGARGGDFVTLWKLPL